MLYQYVYGKQALDLKSTFLCKFTRTLGLGGLSPPPPQEGPRKKGQKEGKKGEREGGGEEKSCKCFFSSPFHLMPLEIFSSFCQNYFIMMSHEISL